jgi:polyphosphate kinase 2 (PPK2 family)
MSQQLDRVGDQPDASTQPSGEPKLKRKEYEEALLELQTELCAVQDWAKQTGQRIIVLFEGRDTVAATIQNRRWIEEKS